MKTKKLLLKLIFVGVISVMLNSNDSFALDALTPHEFMGAIDSKIHKQGWELYFTQEKEERALGKAFQDYIKANPSIDPSTCIYTLGAMKKDTIQGTRKERKEWINKTLSDISLVNPSKTIVGMSIKEEKSSQDYSDKGSFEVPRNKKEYIEMLTQKAKERTDSGYTIVKLMASSRIIRRLGFSEEEFFQLCEGRLGITQEKIELSDDFLFISVFESQRDPLFLVKTHIQYFEVSFNCQQNKAQETVANLSNKPIAVSHVAAEPRLPQSVPVKIKKSVTIEPVSVKISTHLRKTKRIKSYHHEKAYKSKIKKYKQWGCPKF